MRRARLSGTPVYTGRFDTVAPPSCERGGEHVTKYNDGKSQLYSSCAVVANERACVSQSAAHGQARVRTRGRLSTVQTIAAFTAELLLQPLASGGSTVILTATAFSVS